MSEEDWAEWHAKSFMLFLNGDALRVRDPKGRPVRDESYLLLFNAHVDTVGFTLPGAPWGTAWTPVLDTTLDDPFAVAGAWEGGTPHDRMGLSLLVLRRTTA
jgi:isoamylase